MSALRWIWVIFWFSFAGYLLFDVDVDLEVIKKDPFAFVKELSKSSKDKATDMLSQKITIIDQSKLCQMFKLNSKFTDLQRESMIEDLKGKIIEWKLPVYEVSSKSNNVFRIQTFNPSFFECGYVSTSINLVALNDGDLSRIKALKTNDVITIRGKIKGVFLRHIEIDPAIFSNTGRLVNSNINQKSIKSKGQDVNTESFESKNQGVSSNEKISPTLQKQFTSYFESKNWTVNLISDVNKDGANDYIIRGPIDWCGASGGCTHIAFISTNSSFKQYDLGAIYGVEYKNSVDKYFVSAPGAACNLAGYKPCQFQIYWNGGDLVRR